MCTVDSLNGHLYPMKNVIVPCVDQLTPLIAVHETSTCIYELKGTALSTQFTVHVMIMCR